MKYLGLSAFVVALLWLLMTAEWPLFNKQQLAPERERYSDWHKLDGQGKFMPATAGPWQCVADHQTGLVWENKTRDEGIHHGSWTYTWLDIGARFDSRHEGSCAGLRYCHTAALVMQANSERWCGFSDWRVPELEELQTLLDRSYPQPGPLVCPCFLPNTMRSSYWSNTSDRQRRRLGLSFQTGEVTTFPEHAALYVRLVRGQYSRAASD